MKLTTEEITDLLITALEGGSNYWYFLPDLEMLVKEPNCTRVESIIPFLLKNPTVEIPVSDCEDENEILGNISWANIQRADKLLKSDDYKWVLDDVKSESWDASTADVWFQLVVLGEIVYG